MAITPVDEIMSVTELAELWKNGNCTWVVDYLRHINACHITAFTTLVILRNQGECEANKLVNLLMEKFIEERDNFQLVPTSNLGA